MDLIKLYNPANASALKPDEIAALQKLTNDELKQLAKAYPNSVMQKAFLLIVDGRKDPAKQIPTLSTFENLYNLRIRHSLNYIAINFKGNTSPKFINPVKPRRSEVVDLSDTELMSLPGFKTANETIKPSEVVVTKVKRRTMPINNDKTTNEGIVSVTPNDVNSTE